MQELQICSKVFTEVLIFETANTGFQFALVYIADRCPEPCPKLPL